MKNSDLFLELFDDELLRPEGNVSGATPAASCSLDNNISPDKSAQLNNEKSPKSLPKSTNNSVRTEFDFCSALDSEKIEREKKYNKMVSKITGKIKVDPNAEKSLIHGGDTDSSEDEDNKYMDSYNYNTSGVEIKRLLQEKELTKDKEKIDLDDVMNKIDIPAKKDGISKNVAKGKHKEDNKQLALPSKPVVKNVNIYSDPFFGIKIINPMISSQSIQLRMQNKTAVPIYKLQTHLAKKIDSDFVVAGVLVRSVTKQAQNESQYMIWELSDLEDESKCISVFLFGPSYKELWKTQIATVVALLNPTDNTKQKNGDAFSLVVKSPDQVMIWGTSKDYGICKSMKKNGERCGAFVNKSRCQYCIYHVKKEYSKFSSNRTEIQSSMGSNNLNFLRNKVLGKNEVFYGGKSYSALKAPTQAQSTKVKKLSAKDENRLTNLGISVIEKNKVPDTKSTSVSLPFAPRAALALKALNMDSDILKSLSSPTTNAPKKMPSFLQTSSAIEKTQTISHHDQTISKAPSLSNPEDDFDITPKKSTISNKKDKDKTSAKKEPPPKSKNNSTFPSLSNPEDDFDFTPKKSSKTSSNSQSNKKSNSEKKIGKSKTLNDKTSDIELKNENKKNNSNKSDKNVSSLSDPSKSQNKEVKKNLQTKFQSLFNVMNENKKATKSNIDNCKGNVDEALSCSKSKSNNAANVSSKSYSESSSSSSCSSMPKLSALDIVCSGSKPLSSVTNVGSEKVVGTSVSNPPNFRFGNSASTKISKAKARALMFVKNNGPIVKEDPNNIKKQTDNLSRKRDRTQDESSEDGSKDGKVVFSDLYMELMRQTNQQQDLVEAEKLRVEEEYFDKMGLKEQLEEKMLNTFKIDCKAVKCLQCKYIWFSAADVCKAERHTLKIVDAVKRFFKCGNCSNRTVSLHILPMFSCKNCQGSNWQRTSMMREKVCKIDSGLSIRGGEQKFVNSSTTNSNLNLLVPE